MTAEMTAVPAQEPRTFAASDLVQQVRKHCLLVFAEFSTYAGRLLVQNARVLIKEVEVPEGDERVTLPSWRVLPAAWRSTLNRIQGRVRKALRRAGLPLRRGVFMIPIGAARALLEYLHREVAIYRQAAAELIATWDTVKAELRQTVVSKVSDAAWEDLERRLPSQSELATRHRMVYGLWEMVGESGLPTGSLEQLRQDYAQLRGQLAGVNGSTGQALTQLGETVRTLAAAATRAERNLDEAELQSYLGEARRTTQRLMEERIRTAFAEPCQQLDEAVRGLLAHLDSGQNVRANSLALVQRCWDKLRSFEWMGTPELSAALARAGSQLAAGDNSDLNRRNGTGQLMLSALRDVSQQLSNALSGTRSRRVIEME